VNRSNDAAIKPSKDFTMSANTKTPSSFVNGLKMAAGAAAAVAVQVGIMAAGVAAGTILAAKIMKKG
jgi:hypothetical protein